MKRLFFPLFHKFNHYQIFLKLVESNFHFGKKQIYYLSVMLNSSPRSFALFSNSSAVSFIFLSAFFKLFASEIILYFPDRKQIYYLSVMLNSSPRSFALFSNSSAVSFIFLSAFFKLFASEIILYF